MPYRKNDEPDAKVFVTGSITILVNAAVLRQSAAIAAGVSQAAALVSKVEKPLMGLFVEPA